MAVYCFWQAASRCAAGVHTSQLSQRERPGLVVTSNKVRRAVWYDALRSRPGFEEVPGCSDLDEVRAS